MLIQSPVSTPSPVYTTCTCQCLPTLPVCACLPAPVSFSHSLLVLGLCSGLIAPTSVHASFHDTCMSNASSGLTPPMSQCSSKRAFTDSSLPSTSLSPLLPYLPCTLAACSLSPMLLASPSLVLTHACPPMPTCQHWLPMLGCQHLHMPAHAHPHLPMYICLPELVCPFCMQGKGDLYNRYLRSSASWLDSWLAAIVA